MISRYAFAGPGFIREWGKNLNGEAWHKGSLQDDSRPAGTVALTAGMILALTLCSGCGSNQRAPALKDGQTISAHSRSAAIAPKPDNHEAIMLAEALKKAPDHVPVLLRMASLALESGKRDEAAKYLNEVLRHEPNNVAARLDLGKILFEIGKAPDAIQTLEGILKTQPEDPDALYNLGAIYGNLGNNQRALEYWNRLLAKSPESDSGRRARQMMVVLQKDTP